nr:MAG TPA: minor tail protein [Caudoviricetes sp.]
MSTGIGPKIGLDGEKEFKRALSEITQQSKTLSSELKLVKSGFDDETSAQEKAAKTAEVLNKQIENQQKRVELLRQKVEESSKEYGENSTQTLKWQEQLNKAETAMNSMQKELKETETGVKDVGDAEDNASKKTTDFWNIVKANVTSEAITAGIQKIVSGIKSIAAYSKDAWMEIDEGSDTIVTKTGASGEALDDMVGRMKDIATTIPTDFATAGTAIGAVNTRFGLTGDALQSLSQQFIEFANINGTDVNSSIDSVQKAMAAFGVETKDAGKLLDTMNKVGQDTGVSMDTLSSLMVTNATAFQDLGLNAADAANLLGTLEKSGVDTSTVMTGLSKVQKKAMQDGVDSQTALKNALSSSQSAIDIFGSKAGPKLYKAFQNGTLSVKDFTESTHSLNDNLNNVSDTYEATLDPMDEFTTAQNELKTVGATLVDIVLPKFTPLLHTIIDKAKEIDLDELADKAEKLADDLSGKLSAACDFAADHGKELAVAFGTIVGALVTLKGVKAAESISDIGSKLLELATNPAALAAAGIAAVTAATVALATEIRNSDPAYQQYKADMDSLSQSLKDATSANDSLANSLSSTAADIATKGADLDLWKNKLNECFDSQGNLKAGCEETANVIIGQLNSAMGTNYSVSASGFIQNTDGSRVSLEQLNDTIDTTIEQMKRQALQEALKSGYTEALQAQTEAQQALTSAVDAYNNAVEEGNPHLDEYREKLVEAADAAGRANETVAGFSNTMSMAADTANYTEEQVETAFGGISSSAEWAGAAYQAYAYTATESANTVELVNGQVQESTSGMSDSVKSSVDGAKGAWEKIPSTMDKVASSSSSNTAKISKDASKMQSDISSSIATASGNMKSGVSSMESSVRNAKWEWPHIKLPHFSISGEFNLFQGQIPHVNVEWYAKAMHDGMILNSPTIFGYQNGKLLGGGEAGPEVVVGATNLVDMIGKAVAQNTYDYGGFNIVINAAPGQSEERIAELVEENINDAVARKRMVYA